MPSRTKVVTGFAPVPGSEAIKILRGFRDIHTGEYFTDGRAKRLLEIARIHGYKAEPCMGGIVGIRCHGTRPSGINFAYSIEDRTGNSPGKPAARVAEGNALGYNHGKNLTRKTARGIPMPPSRTRTRTRPAQPPAEPEVNESNGEAPDQDAIIDRYLTKALTFTQSDFIEWFDANVTDHVALGKTDPDRLMILANQTYGMFQQSDFNRDRKAERKAEREQAAAAETEPEPTPAPARAGARRGRGKPATAATAEPAGNAAPARPARGRRTAATGAAPF
jgi:hypothetical protein